MDGDTVIAKILKAEGVEWMTCFPSHSLIDAAAREGIRPIVCRQERAGVNIADGASRTNNGKTVGVFCMQRGPGAENAFGGVAQAFADSVPMLVLPGGHAKTRTQVPQLLCGRELSWHHEVGGRDQHGGAHPRADGAGLQPDEARETRTGPPRDPGGRRQRGVSR